MSSGNNINTNWTIDDEVLRSEVLINPVPTRGRKPQYKCDCPFCGKESHFYINRLTQMWDCKKCWQSGNLYKLLKFLDKLYLLGGRTVKEREALVSVREMLEERVTGDGTEELSEMPEVKLPAGWKVLKNGSPYLDGRGVSAEECRRYEIGSTKIFPKYKNYIIIPIRDDGVIRGFIGRYASKSVPRDALRYNNSLGTEFARLLFGYDEIVEGKTETVILVEGVFDKIAVDRVLDTWSDDSIKCVATFGKKISDYQISKLVRKQVGSVVLLYDYDAIREIKRYGLELEKFFITNITFTTRKDIDECTRDEALEVFNHLQEPHAFAEDVIGKLKR